MVKKPIFFNARKLKDRTPAAGSKHVYKEINDNVGSAFDKNTGIFTAPVDGYYLFTVQRIIDGLGLIRLFLLIPRTLLLGF